MSNDDGRLVTADAEKAALAPDDVQPVVKSYGTLPGQRDPTPRRLAHPVKSGAGASGAAAAILEGFPAAVTRAATTVPSPPPDARTAIS